MKKIMVLLITLFIIIIITISFKDRKIYYLSLGDSIASGLTSKGTIKGYNTYLEEYLSKNNVLELSLSFAQVGYRTIDIINQINNNESIIHQNKKISIKNALIKADLLTLSIGTNDIMNILMTYKSYSTKELYVYLDELLTDLDTLFKQIRVYCKEKIIFIGYYNFLSNTELNPFFDYLNSAITKITKNYNIDIIIPSNKFNKYVTENDIHPNEYGYLELFNQIKQLL